MKSLTLIAIAIATSLVWGDKIYAAAKKAQDIYLDHKLEEISKAQAMKMLILDKGARVLRCQEVELTDKVTLKRKVGVRE